jgi:hypothetical protein
MKLEQAKFKALQVKEGPSSLSMNAMVEAIKVLQTLVVNKRTTNIQLSLELKEVQKEKRARPNKEATKAMKTQTPNPFTRKDTKKKKVRQWAFQTEAYFESQAINKDMDWFRLVQSLAQKNGDLASFTTHNESEYWNCNANANGPKRGQNKKWDKTPPKDKGTPTEKKNCGMLPKSNVSTVWGWAFCQGL